MLLKHLDCLLVGHRNNWLLVIIINYFGSQKQYKVSINRDNRLPHSIINYHDSENVEKGYYDRINQLQLLVID